MNVLAGDIGGTHSRLALLDMSAGRIGLLREEIFPSAAFPGLEPILERFLAAPVFSEAVSSPGSPRRATTPLPPEPHASAADASPRADPSVIDRACFGVPGAVHEGVTRTTNLPWIVDGARLAAVLGMKRESVDVINDLEAWAWGIDALSPEDFVVLQEGSPDSARPAALIAAGTGLGEALLVRERGRSRPIPSEGGHADFAPNGFLQGELWRFLHGRFGHVSWERVLSGPGLAHIYDFLRGYGKEPEPPWLSEALRTQDPGAVITTAGLEQRDPVCVQALDLFVSVYGAEAGNMGLRLLALGGVFLGGGIAPRILPRLKGPLFLDAFRAKGRMSPLMEQIPVKVTLNDRTALLGAARCAVNRS